MYSQPVNKRNSHLSVSSILMLYESCPYCTIPHDVLAGRRGYLQVRALPTPLPHLMVEAGEEGEQAEMALGRAQ